MIIKISAVIIGVYFLFKVYYHIRYAPVIKDQDELNTNTNKKESEESK